MKRLKSAIYCNLFYKEEIAMLQVFISPSSEAYFWGFENIFGIVFLSKIKLW